MEINGSLNDTVSGTGCQGFEKTAGCFNETDDGVREFFQSQPRGNLAEGRKPPPDGGSKAWLQGKPDLYVQNEYLTDTYSANGPSLECQLLGLYKFLWNLPSLLPEDSQSPSIYCCMDWQCPDLLSDVYWGVFWPSP